MAPHTWDEYMRPVLQALENEPSMSIADMYAAVAHNVALSEEEMREVISSGQPRYKNRIGWATTYLTKAGAVERPKRATYAITDRGRQLLGEGAPITVARLTQFPEVREFLQPTRQHTQKEATTLSPGDESPEEVIENAAKQLQTILEADLLDRLINVDPYAFERLVIKVLGAMGYGKDGSLETTVASGDGGIDGVISQDPLGLDRIYVQAKRFTGMSVQPKDIQAFMGALSTSHGDRGVFITTSRFTNGARETAQKSTFRIELIDGHKLVQLMVKNGVGVQPESVTTIYRIDDDFFEDL